METSEKPHEKKPLGALGNMIFCLNGQASISKTPILLVITNVFAIGLTIFTTWLL